MAAVGKSFADHGVRFHAIKDVEEIVRIAAHQSAGESDQPLCRSSKHAETVTLCRVAGQLVQLIGDGKVEPSAHVPTDKLDWRHALNTLAVGLPECRIAHRSPLWQSQQFKELDLIDEVEVGEFLPLRIQDCSASVGIDDAAQIRSGFRLDVDVFPVVAKLPLVLARDEESRRRAALAPLLAAHSSEICK